MVCKGVSREEEPERKSTYLRYKVISVSRGEMNGVRRYCHSAFVQPARRLWSADEEVYKSYTIG